MHRAAHGERHCLQNPGERKVILNFSRRFYNVSYALYSIHYSLCGMLHYLECLFRVLSSLTITWAYEYAPYMDNFSNWSLVFSALPFTQEPRFPKKITVIHDLLSLDYRCDIPE